MRLSIALGLTFSVLASASNAEQQADSKQKVSFRTNRVITSNSELIVRNDKVVLKKSRLRNTFFTYDIHGRVKGEISSDGSWADYVYDSHDQLSEIRYSDGRKLLVRSLRDGRTIVETGEGKSLPVLDRLTKTGAVSYAASMSASSPALQATIVDSEYTTYCTEGSEEACIVEIEPGGGGGGYIPPGGSGYGGNHGLGPSTDPRNVFGGDDGTRGKGVEFNRFKWGCDHEIRTLYHLAVDVYNSGTYVGKVLQLSQPLTDQNYNNGQWIKVESDNENFTIATAGSQRRMFVRIHYMYNVTTGQMHQMKFKTSYESGCLGWPQ